MWLRMRDFESWTLFGPAKMVRSLALPKTPTPLGNPVSPSVLSSVSPTGIEIQLKCNSAPFLYVVGTVCALLIPFRTEGLSATADNFSCQMPWGLPQLKKAALLKGMPLSQSSLHPVHDWWTQRPVPIPTPSSRHSYGAGWGLCWPSIAAQCLLPPILLTFLPFHGWWLPNKPPECWSPSQS